MLWEIPYWELLQLEVIYARRNRVDCIQATPQHKRKSSLWEKLQALRKTNG